MNWGQLRICVEKPLPSEHRVLACKNCDRAAYLKQKLWDLTDTVTGEKIEITVEFLDDGKDVDWTPLQSLKGYDQNENLMLQDPLNDKLYKKVTPKQYVERVVRERIAPNVGIKFRFVNKGGKIRISFDPMKGAYSLLGTDCLRSTNSGSTMNLGWLDVGTVTHEFMHALGAIHEHQNPKGITIDWDENKVYEWARSTQGWDRQTTYTNIIERYKVEQLNASEYDPQSVMLYFYPSYLTKNNKGTRQNVRLSEVDVEWLNKMYPGGGVSPSDFYAKAFKGSDKRVRTITFLVLVIFFGIIGLIVMYILFRKYSIESRIKQSMKRK